MRRRLVLLLAFALAAGSAWLLAAPAQQASGLFSEIQSMVSELAEMSDLKPLRQIQYDLISKDRVKEFLEQRVKEAVTPEEIRAEELTLKKFGFVPADFDLKASTVDLFTEQAAAFYDFRKKKLFLLDSAPSLIQQTALVHELAHALADQHHNLEKFINSARQSDDGAAARLAVTEGQASWLMAEYMARRSGQSLKTSPALLDFMARAAEMSAGQFPVFDKAPLYMRETLLFPYTAGMRFQHALVEKSGKAAFQLVFRQPPSSTQQILHPEKYFAGEKPSSPALPRLASEREYATLAEGSIGELDHSILLRQYVGKEEAASLAPLWKGGAYKLLEHKKDKRLVLKYAAEWSDERSAREYFGLYQKVLGGKWKNMEISTRGPAEVAGLGDGGYFVLRQDRSVVTSVEGLRSLSDVRWMSPRPTPPEPK